METNKMKLDGRMILNFDHDAFYAWAAKNDIQIKDICDELGFNHSYFSNARLRNRLKLSTYKSVMKIYEDLIDEDFLIDDEKSVKPKKPETIIDKFGRVVTRRGHIYKVIDRKKHSTALFLVLSPDEMGSNKYILGTFLNDYLNDTYDDVFRISNKWCVSVDRLTYVDRVRFTEDMAYLPDDILEVINVELVKRIGL